MYAVSYLCHPLIEGKADGRRREAGGIVSTRKNYGGPRGGDEGKEGAT